MSQLNNTKFFITPKHPCSYLNRNDATTLFADPNRTVSQSMYSTLSNLGFRRSGRYIYRPNCRHCSECTPTRILVHQLNTQKRRYRRILLKNKDIKTTKVQEADKGEHYKLYEKYIYHKHKEGDMFPPSPEQYQNFLLSTGDYTHFFELRISEQLVAVIVTDLLHNGLSAVYTFYEPELPKRSLGIYAILWQIQQAKILGLTYLYLGYWVKSCQKMSYKSQFRPVEMFIDNHWKTYQ